MPHKSTISDMYACVKSPKYKFIKVAAKKFIKMANFGIEKKNDRAEELLQIQKITK